MTDLVQRLHSERSPLCLEAAREIERTAAMLREAKAEIIRCLLYTSDAADE